MISAAIRQRVGQGQVLAESDELRLALFSIGIVIYEPASGLLVNGKGILVPKLAFVSCLKKIEPSGPPRRFIETTKINT